MQFWRFNADENRLIFTTDTAVQPRAQLIPNPTRLVIDLPGTSFGQPLVNQAGEGAIREVRVGQFDAQTTRIVVELNEGYTIDPQQVRVRGATPTQWVVEIPDPQPLDESVAETDESSPLAMVTSGDTSPIVPGAATVLEGIRVTPDGIFVRTSGATPEIEVERNRRQEQVTIDFEDTALSSQLAQRELNLDSFGVNRIELSQEDESPPRARVTLDLADREVDLQATVSTFGGVVVIPQGGEPIQNRPPSSLQIPRTAAEPVQQPATIQSIELANGGTQLLIRADRPIETFTGGWDRATTDYQITIPNARLADQIADPRLGANSPLLRVRLRQEENDTVIISLQPAARAQIGEISQPSQQLLALPLQQSVPVTPTPPVYSPGNPVTLPTVPSTIPNSQVVIVIDPGHGGPDPGAVGIGGLREKDVVLPISRQVVQILQQQGMSVVMTRQDDRDLDLEPRVQIAERVNADIFISIHANAINLSRPDVNGIETYYYSDRGYRMAQIIHRNMVQLTGRPDRGVRRARFYVIRNTSMPAVLLETGFVTGGQDAPLLADPGFQSRMAQAIARGILEYVQQNF
ncbi:MAG: N-acetylmuramoyl-L-alanine amidase [Elainellaceae cyanobacterium]